MTVSVLIVAAGRGRRFGGETPKQYIPLAGPCALRRSIEAFLAVDAVSLVRAVIHPDDKSLYDEALLGLNDSRVLHPTHGGDTRAQSVCLGLQSLRDRNPRSVLIHDAARPFVSGEVIASVIEALRESEGATAALPLVDALWQASEGNASASIPREGIWRAQTPQGFHFDRILNAHLAHDGTGVDDVAVAREAGLNVRLVQGAEQNYKITTTADLRRALIDVAQSDAGTKVASGARAATKP